MPNTPCAGLEIAAVGFQSSTWEQCGDTEMCAEYGIYLRYLIMKGMIADE